MTNVEMAKALFQAFADGNDEVVRSLCKVDIKAVQNGGSPMDLSTLLAFSAAVRSVVTNFRYENAMRSATQNGFVEEHDVCGSLPGGETVRLVICVVGDVNDGQITHLREYFDSAAAAKVIKHLSPA